MEEEKIRISADALIALIVTEAERRELEGLPPVEAMETVEPSPGFRQKMKALVRKARRRTARRRLFAGGKRVLVCLAAVLSVFFCCMLPVEGVRDAMTNTLLEWHDEFMKVTFTQEAGLDPESLPTISLGYIPEGFAVEKESSHGHGSYYGAYRDPANEWFLVYVVPLSSDHQVFLDNETSTFYSLTFDGHDALWGYMGGGQQNLLLWEKDGMSYMVQGTMDVGTLIQIAQGIEFTYEDTAS